MCDVFVTVSSTFIHAHNLIRLLSRRMQFVSHKYFLFLPVSFFSISVSAMTHLFLFLLLPCPRQGFLVCPWTNPRPSSILIPRLSPFTCLHFTVKCLEVHLWLQWSHTKMTLYRYDLKGSECTYSQELMMNSQSCISLKTLYKYKKET